ncbi:MAG: hypothetical protein V4754_08190 [Pseudomonadota bacterium]
MSNIATPGPTRVRPTRFASVRRYLKRSIVMAGACHALGALALFIMLTARPGRGSGYELLGTVMLCAIPCAISLANLSLAALMALCSPGLRPAGGAVFLLYGAAYCLLRY